MKQPSRSIHQGAGKGAHHTEGQISDALQEAKPSDIGNEAAMTIQRQLRSDLEEMVDTSIWQIVHLVLDRVLQTIDPANYRHYGPVDVEAINQRRRLLGQPEITKSFIEKNRELLMAGQVWPHQLEDSKTVPEELRSNIYNIFRDFLSVYDNIEGLMKKSISPKFKDISDILENLPEGEIDRAREILQRRAEKWEGIPKEAPELYRDRKASEPLLDFLRRAYGDRGLLTGQLARTHIDILDPPLGAAIREWLSRHEEFPSDINLPAKPSQDEKKTRSRKVPTKGLN